MKFIIVFVCLSALFLPSQAWSAGKWCIQSPVYSSEAEARKEASKYPEGKGRIEKVKTGYLVVLGEYTSEEEARAKWEKTVAILPGSVIRRCDENPSPEVKSIDREIIQSAERKRKAGDARSALEDLKKALEMEKERSAVAARILYEMANCYDALNEKELARETYRKAIELNPASGIAPPEVTYEEGFKAYKRKEFSRALRIFAQYSALYPKFRAQAYYFMACSLMELKKYRQAVYFFDRIIKEHPETTFASESILALGNIGLIRPKVKVLPSMAGFDYVRDPISAYNEVLKRDLPPEKRDQVLLSKAYGYMAMGRPEIAHRILVECIRKFAAGPYRAQARLVCARNLPAAIKAYEERKERLGVIGVFFQSLSLNLPFPTDLGTIRSIAGALKELGFKEELHSFLKAARVKVNGKDVPEIDKMMADMEKPPERKAEITCEDYYREYESVKARGSVPSASLTLAVAECRFQAKDYKGSLPYYDYVVKYTGEGIEKVWAKLRLGQASYRAGKKEEAGQIFSTLKDESKEEFWTRVAEFAEEAEKWKENDRLITQGRSPGTTYPLP